MVVLRISYAHEVRITQNKPDTHRKQNGRFSYLKKQIFFPIQMLYLLILLPLPFKTIMVHIWYVPYSFPHVSFWFPFGNPQVSMPRNHGNRSLGCFLSGTTIYGIFEVFNWKQRGNMLEACFFFLFLPRDGD